MDALLDASTGAWNYTNAEGPNYLNLCDLMGESEPIVPSPSPSSVTNPPSSAHKCTHWQSIAMVVQVAAFFASLQ